MCTSEDKFSFICYQPMPHSLQLTVTTACNLPNIIVTKACCKSFRWILISIFIQNKACGSFPPSLTFKLLFECTYVRMCNIGPLTPRFYVRIFSIKTLSLSILLKFVLPSFMRYKAYKMLHTDPDASIQSMKYWSETRAPFPPPNREDLHRVLWNSLELFLCKATLGQGLLWHWKLMAGCD